MIYSGALAAAAASDPNAPKERVTDKVNKEIMAQLVEMGFPEVRAEKGLWLTGEALCFQRPCRAFHLVSTLTLSIPPRQ